MTLSRSVELADHPDYAVLPRLRPTDRQLAYARRVAGDAGIEVPGAVQHDRKSLSDWISRHTRRRATDRPMENDRPSSRQVAYAERIARGRQREIPNECYKSRALLSF